MRLSRAISRSPWSTWISTDVWLSAAVEKTSLFLVGIVVLRSISLVVTPPSVSMPSESGVTSSSSTSLTSPASTPAWIAAPIATTSSGLTPLCGSLPKNSFTSFWMLRHARLAADEHDLVDVLGLEPGVLQRLLHGPMDRSRRSSTSCSSFARVSFSCRCLGPEASAVMNGRLISVSTTSRARSWPSPPPPSGAAAPSGPCERSMPWSFLNSARIQSMIALVEVVAAQVRVAVGGLHLDDALADLEDRDVERAAAEVVDGDRLVLLLVEAVGERGRRRLVDDPLDRRGPRSARRPWWPGAASR